MNITSLREEAEEPRMRQVEDCPELNLSNYDATDVERLNDWAVRADAEIDRLTKPAAVPIGARDPVGFAQHLLSTCDVGGNDGR